MDFEKYIGVTEDFPKKGISFKDISPLLANPDAFQACIDEMAKIAEEYHIDYICGPESRAFLFGAALGYKMHKGFVMARKAGKLPGVTIKVSYQLEYATAAIEIPANSFPRGSRVLLIDDLMATGGTFSALKTLIEQAGGEPVCCLTLINLEDLHGEEKISLPCRSLLNLKGE